MMQIQLFQTEIGGMALGILVHSQVQAKILFEEWGVQAQFQVEAM